MKANVSVRSISGASTNGVKHHVKGCVEDIWPDTVILHHGTNAIKSGNTSEKIATDINYTKWKNQSFTFQDWLSEMTISIKDGKK